MVDATYSIGATLSLLTCILGILTNTTSLLYFVRKGDKGLVNGLFITLNSYDLATCITGALLIITTYLSDDESFHVIKSLYSWSVQGTAVSTVLLTVCRTRMVLSPLSYRPNTRVVVLVVVLVAVLDGLAEGVDLVLVLEHPDSLSVVFKEYRRVYYLAAAVVVLLVVLASNSLAVWTLHHCELSATVTHATKTVLIISALFCVSNSLITAHLVLLVAKIQNDRVSIWAYFIAIPINSAINPLIYMMRNKSMRTIIKCRILNVVSFVLHPFHWMSRTVQVHAK